MLKSFFSRVFIICFITAVTILLLLMSLVTETVRTNYINDKMQDMKSAIIELNAYRLRQYYGEISINAFYRTISEFAVREKSEVWIADKNKNIYFVADDKGNMDLVDMRLSEELSDIFPQLMKGNTVSFVSTDNKTFNAPIILVAAPHIVNGELSGALFMFSKVSNLNASIEGIRLQIYNCTLIALVIAGVMAFFFSRFITKDIKKIAASATKLSYGDFSSRVQINNKTELGELAGTFNNMADELEKQEKMKSTFVADVSHELRTPMTSIQGFIQGMLDGAIEEKDRDMYLRTVLGETKRLNALISDLLEISRLDSDKMKLDIDSFDVNELLRRCLLTFEQAIDNKQLDIDIGFDDNKNIVYADQDRIAQVVTNIIDNAVKFSETKGKLSIGVRVSGDKTWIGITDTGSGIPEEDLPFVFERFYKADKSRGQKVGTGLGLAIVKKIIDAHEETITVTSKKDEGTTFAFSLSNVAKTKLKQNSGK